VIGLDTNVLLRHVMQDDPAQSKKATSIIEGLTAKEPGYVSHVVLAELAWVLERSYKIPDTTIASTIVGILHIGTFVVQDEEAVVLALRAMSDGRGTFADALISILSERAGCDRTLTFDRRAIGLPGFELI
jgi:predicted nucleic-acid-binding protein